MNLRRIVFPFFVHFAALVGCSSDATRCGFGTHKEGGVCVSSDAGMTSQDSSIGMDASQFDAGSPLPEGLFPIKGTSASLPHDDLAPLLSIIGDSRVVGLGESIHTSGGYSQMKVRLFRYLVEELGFRLYAFETPWPDADLVGDYVSSCNGDPFDVVSRGLFGVWANRSVLELVQWMCRWNLNHPDDPVSFFGFDVQQPWDDGPRLREFLRVAAPNRAAKLSLGIDGCDGVNSGTAEEYYSNPPSWPLPAAEVARCMAGLDAIDQFMEENRAGLILATSTEAFELAAIASIGIRGWEGIAAFGDEDLARSIEARDRAMAAVFRRLRALRYGDAKAAIWAHNGHISTNQHLVDSGFPEGRSMGTYLKQELGDEYLAIGFTGYNVSINWPGVGVGPTPVPANPESLEARLHELDQPWLLLDLEPPLDGTPFLQSGARIETQGGVMVPREQYRAMIYFEESPMMEALLW